MKRFMLLYNHRRGEKRKKGKVKKMMMMMKKEMIERLEQLETLRSRAYVIDHWTGNNNNLILKIEKEINEIKKKL